MSRLAAFQLDDDLFWKFKDKCHNEGVTMTERVRILIQNYLQQPKQEFVDQVTQIEKTLYEMSIDDIKRTNDIVKTLYEKTTEPGMKNRLAILGNRLRDRYHTLQETKSL